MTYRTCVKPTQRDRTRQHVADYFSRLYDAPLSEHDSIEIAQSLAEFCQVLLEIASDSGPAESTAASSAALPLAKPRSLRIRRVRGT